MSLGFPKGCGAARPPEDTRLIHADFRVSESVQADDVTGLRQRGAVSGDPIKCAAPPLVPYGHIG